MFGENRWPPTICLICWNKRTTFWPVKHALIWADVRELALPLWTMIRLFLFVFRISAKKVWCTTQSWSCNVVQVEHNRLPFASKYFFHKQLSLDLVCLRRPTWWTVVLFWAHSHRSMILHLWRSYTFLGRLRDSTRIKVF